MTSISLSSLAVQRPSPRDDMNSRIAAAASSGEISSADQSALSSALDTIDESLSSTSGEKRPEDMKSRVDSLIDAQVSSGTLTDAQATELKSFFAQGPSGGGNGEGGGPGGPRGPGGPPPGPPPADQSGSSDGSDSSSTETSSASDQLEALKAFLKDLRNAASSTSTYGSDASKNATAVTRGLVLNTSA